jgi:hypothetical protein
MIMNNTHPQISGDCGTHKIMQPLFPSPKEQSILVDSRNQLIDAYTSHKITVLSFICSLAVILLHSYNWRFKAGYQISLA